MDMDLTDWKEWSDYCDEVDALNIEEMHRPVITKPVEKVVSICECGGTKTRTPHSLWCPVK